jgi:hypothetical protein
MPRRLFHQNLTGHSRRETNKHYTHLELKRLRRAVDSIFRLPGKALDRTE